MADWWNTKYFVRRNIFFAVNPLDTVQIGYPLFAKLDYNALLASNKVRPDFTDIEVIYNNGLTNTVIPHYTYVQSPYIFVQFNAMAPITDTSFDYWIYMGNTQLTNEPVVSAYVSADYAIDTSTGSGLGLTFSRPTEDWINGLSLTNEAKATFVFVGINARLIVEKGPSRGMMEIQVDNQSPFILDTYASTESEQIIYTTSDLTLAKHYIRIKTSKQKNAASSGNELKIVKFEYSKYTEGIDQGEEIYSSAVSIRIVVGP